MISRDNLRLLVLALACVAGGFGAGVSAGPGDHPDVGRAARPNIVVILADDPALGADRLA